MRDFKKFEKRLEEVRKHGLSAYKKWLKENDKTIYDNGAFEEFRETEIYKNLLNEHNELKQKIQNL